MCCLLVLGLAGPSSAGDGKTRDLPADVFVPAKSAPLASLAVFPSEISLTTARDRQSIVVQATFTDGITRDVTKEATLTLADPKPVRRDGAVFYPVADGATTLSVGFGGQTVAVPVKVAQATVSPPISFRLDVMPVFMRAGCNTGSCHGAARGKDGFRISLFGFDPEGDHFRLTREMVGRRINRAVPAESTLLEKATGAVPHTGGKRFEPASELYRTLHTWIQSGALNDDPAKMPTVVGVDLYPKQAVLDGKGVDAAVDGPCPILRRHRSRRHQPGRVPDQQRRLGPGQHRWPGHGGRSRRGVRDGPVRDPHRRLAVHRAAQGPQLHFPERARDELHRQAGQRQAQEAADRPFGSVR